MRTTSINTIFQIGQKIINYLSKPKIEGFYVEREAKENLEYNLNDIKNDIFGSEIFLLPKKKLERTMKIILNVLQLVICKFENLNKTKFSKIFLQNYYSFCLSIIKNATVFKNLNLDLQKEILSMLNYFARFKDLIDVKSIRVYQNNFYSFLKYNNFPTNLIKSKIEEKGNGNEENDKLVKMNMGQLSIDKISQKSKYSFANFKGSESLNQSKSEIFVNDEIKFERALSDNDLQFNKKSKKNTLKENHIEEMKSNSVIEVIVENNNKEFLQNSNLSEEEYLYPKINLE